MPAIRLWRKLFVLSLTTNVVIVAYNTRMWKSVDAPHCIGRYVPDTEAIALQEKREGVQADTFAEWLRLTTNLAVDTEVNIQLGEFTLKNTVEPIDERFRGFGDFAAVFGGSCRCQRRYSAEVAHCNTATLGWIGWRRHDLQLWKPDSDPSISHAVDSPFTAREQRTLDTDAVNPCCL